MGRHETSRLQKKAVGLPILFFLAGQKIQRKQPPNDLAGEKLNWGRNGTGHRRVRQLGLGGSKYHLPAEKLIENIGLAPRSPCLSLSFLLFLATLNQNGGLHAKKESFLGARGNSDGAGARDSRWVRVRASVDPAARPPPALRKLSLLSFKAQEKAFMRLFLCFSSLPPPHSLPICFRAFQSCCGQEKKPGSFLWRLDPYS